MNCPVCKADALTERELEPHLCSHHCDVCGGNWINSFDFSRWQETQAGGACAQSGTVIAEPPAIETKGPRICPECGRLLTKYKVGHSMPFSLERCGNCGGTWFDRNEWEFLRGSSLGGQIHLIFSPAWQNRVREEEHSRHLAELFAQKIGGRDFAEIKRIKAWLDGHPHRQELYSYLNHGES